MCGIAGIINGGGDAIYTMQQMLAAQAHRGPDAQQYAQPAQQVLLGHNRLSIIDLAVEANQPMVSASGRYWIVFNGEIYNYLELREELASVHGFVFRTHSDTEVLLAAFEQWGANCLEKLNGMFAFAIWDIHDQTLFAARDRFGVKPFYYIRNTDNGLVFASEIKTLAAGGISLQAHEEVWASFFAYGSYGAPEQTFWSNIHQLPGGHYLVWNNGKISVARWYHFEDAIRSISYSNNNNWQDTYRALLDDAVKLRFRADVPVGFNLSGGLDSSTLLALVHKQIGTNSGIEAFTFTTGHTDYDELPWVQQMVAQTGNPLNECRLDVDDIPELAAEMSLHQLEPYGGLPTIAYSKVFERARQKGIIVLLDGQGMDEAWAGYDYYTKMDSGIVQGTHTSPVRPEALDNEFMSLASKLVYPRPFESSMQNTQYRDLFYTKIPRALRFNDRVSMMHSTELREPFLDYRLVELAFSRSDDVKVRDGQTKWMLRQIARNLLGDKLSLATPANTTARMACQRIA
jgi:asparagine synthase (glutamine-hydrolysing)